MFCTDKVTSYKLKGILWLHIVWNCYKTVPCGFLAVYFCVWHSKALMNKLLDCNNQYSSPCNNIWVFMFSFSLFLCCVLQISTYQFWRCTRPSATCVAVTIRRRRCSCVAPSTPTLLHGSSGNVGTCSLNRARTTEWTSMNRFTLRYTQTHAQHRHCQVRSTDTARCAVASRFLLFSLRSASQTELYPFLLISCLGKTHSL